MSTPADHARESADVPTLLQQLAAVDVSEHPQIFATIHQRLQGQLQRESGESWDD